MKKKKLVMIAVLLTLVLGAWLWLLYHDGGVTHREIASKIDAESRTVQAKVDARCDALERKLDRIESKLDRLIEMATPKLPDGMKVAE